MFHDSAIRELVAPTNGVKPQVFVPPKRTEFGPVLDQQVQPASLDVRLARELIRHPDGSDLRMGDQGYILEPGECLLGTLVESFEMRTDNLAARIEGKSSWARKFLTVHSAGFIDPGFCGDITLELKNDGHKRLLLLPGVIIAQVSFHFLAGPVERMYGEMALGSHYQFQRGPTESCLRY